MKWGEGYRNRRWTEDPCREVCHLKKTSGYTVSKRLWSKRSIFSQINIFPREIPMLMVDCGETGVRDA